jgi:hypothetical protein
MNVATRRMPCASSVRLRRGASLPRVIRPKPTTAKPLAWPLNSACGRSRRIATAASGPCMPRLASASRPVPS